MEQIKLTQTQSFSSASSVANESLDGPDSASTVLDERVIVDKVSRVRRGHCKGVGCIIKGKRKPSKTSYFIVASYSTVVSRSEKSQVADDQHRFAERVDAHQRDLEAQHHEINALKAFITQTLGQAPPSPPPPPPPLPPSNDAEDLARD